MGQKWVGQSKHLFILFFYAFLQAYLTSQGKPWLSFTALNVWMSTHQSPPGTTIQMEHILALVSHTCFSWFTQSTDPRGLPTSLSQGRHHFSDLLCGVFCRFNLPTQGRFSCIVVILVKMHIRLKL